VEFSTWLLGRLAKKGWSGAEFARRLKVTPGAVNKWVNGKAKPTRNHIPSIARALEISEQDVWDAVREATYFRGGDSAIMRALNLPPDMTPEEARYLHLAYGAFRKWLEEQSAEEGANPAHRRAS
jgi:transcriptional regulator with XRE-family HTH domain